MATEKVEINTASLGQLDEIIGIGPTLGQKIIDARPFLSIDDLTRVKGIGKKTLQKIKYQRIAYVTPQGSLPFVVEQTIQPIIKTAAKPITATNEPVKEAPVTIGSPVVYPTGIILNEALPSPKGTDESEEWIVSTIQPILLVCL